MSLNEFKLYYYFSKYKDYPISSREHFIRHFRYNEGEFVGLKNLIIIIEQYQIKRYKQTLQGERTSRWI